MRAHMPLAETTDMVKRSIDAGLRRFRRTRASKYDAELTYWRGELQHLREWFEDGTRDWWGIPAPTGTQKRAPSDVWSVNAIYTMHALRPSYHEELQLDRDAFTRQ